MIRYTPLTPVQIVTELAKLGCVCNGADPDPAISSTVSHVEDDLQSYRAKHSCSYCGKVVTEIADPNYVMPPDVD